MRVLSSLVRGLWQDCLELLALPWLVFIAYGARFRHRPVQVGLGPEPLLNNVSHAEALRRQGYSAETFVVTTYFITREFDHDFSSLGGLQRSLHCFRFAVRRYQMLYLYFNGGPLLETRWLWRWEPFLLSLARVKVVMLHYGGDIQEMSRCRNPRYKHALSQDYPSHRFRRARIAAQIDLWTRWADHIVAGCDAVDYLYHWDTLVPWHLSIDESRWDLPPVSEGPLRVLHAPNHRAIKGTATVIEAVERLRSQGRDIELVLLERVSNEEVRRVMATVDVVVDQLVIGWYGLFALEGMAARRAVLGYLNPEWIDLYGTHDLPMLNCRTVDEVASCLEGLTREAIRALGTRGREYVERRHSLAVIGEMFARINSGLGIRPSAGLPPDAPGRSASVALRAAYPG